MPNGSFEEHNNINLYPRCIISNYYEFNSIVSDWDSPIKSSPDHKIKCGTARTGNAMAGIISYSYGDEDVYREYLQVKLKEPLVKGEVYRAQMYIKLEYHSDFATNGIGMYFSESHFYDYESKLINDVIPQIKTFQVVKDSVNWLKISQEFVAETNAEYLTIGNFEKQSNIEQLIMDKVNWRRAYAYYDIDDVSVSKSNCSKTYQVCKGDQETLTSCLTPSTGLVGWAKKEHPSQIISSNTDLIVFADVSTTYLVYSKYDTVEHRVLVTDYPIIDLGNDTTLCYQQQLLLSVSEQNIQYLWQNKSTSTSQKINKEGIYWVQANRNECITRDSIHVKYYPTLISEWTKDTNICSENFSEITLQAFTPNSTNYLWSNGSQDSLLIVNESGIYWVEITSENCFIKDTIDITVEYCEVEIVMPNVITPNYDLKNDLFIPIVYKGIATASIVIYNRWGQEVYFNNDVEVGWDAAAFSTGIYYWLIEYTGIKGQKGNLKGDVTLLK